MRSARRAVLIGWLVAVLVAGCTSSAPPDSVPDRAPTTVAATPAAVTTVQVPNHSVDRVVTVVGSKTFAALATANDTALPTLFVYDGRLRDVTPAGWTIRDAAWFPDGSKLLVEWAQGRAPTTPSNFGVLTAGGQVVDTFQVSQGLYGTTGLAVAPSGTFAVVSAQAPSQFETDQRLWQLDLGTHQVTPIGGPPTTGLTQPQFVAESTLQVLTVKVETVTLPPNGDVAEVRIPSGAPHSLDLQPEVVVALGRGRTRTVVGVAATSTRREGAVFELDGDQLGARVATGAVTSVGVADGGRQLISVPAGGEGTITIATYRSPRF